MSKAMALGGLLFCSCALSTSVNPSSPQLSSSWSSNAMNSSSSTSAMSSSATSSSSVLAPLKRLVGYLPAWNDNNTFIDHRSPNLSHLILAFANPDSNCSFGVLNQQSLWQGYLARRAELQSQGLKLMVSVGGGYVPPGLQACYPTHPQAMQDSLVAWVVAQNLDGVDVDLESQWASDTAHYDPWVRGLAAQLHAHGKLISAAVSSYWNAGTQKATLDSLDWVNVMSYDATGSWNPKVIGQHSPFALAQSDAQTWAIKTGNADKVVVGVPFYGYRFYTGSFGAAADMDNFSQIFSQYPQALDQDSVGSRGGPDGIYFYNGRPTIAAKTRLARQYGGLMIWELSADILGDSSLMHAVDLNVK